MVPGLEWMRDEHCLDSVVVEESAEVSVVSFDVCQKWQLSLAWIWTSRGEMGGEVGGTLGSTEEKGNMLC